VQKNFAKQCKVFYPITCIIKDERVFNTQEFVINRIFAILFLVFSLSVVIPSRVEAEIDPKISALLTMAGYGTVCGALLGLASQMAFDTGGRSISQGASLGLYAGMFFGGYVVSSYYMKKNSAGRPKDIYDPNLNPYDSGGGYYQSWDPYFEMEKQHTPASGINPLTGGKKRISPEFYLNLFRFQF